MAFENLFDWENGLTTGEVIWVQQGSTGTLVLVEIPVAPAPIPDAGQLFVLQGDSNLYFEDDSGTVHQLTPPGGGGGGATGPTGYTGYTGFTGYTGPGTEATVAVTQIGHGFVVGNVIRESGAPNDYTLAMADNATNAEVVGIVTTITDANNFSYTTEGLITAGVPAQAAGTVMFLDPSVAGALTTVNPTTIGLVSKPLVILLESGARMLLNNWRGQVIAAAPAGTTGYTGYTGYTGPIGTTGFTGPESVTLTNTVTLTNKRLTKRVVAVAQSATPAIDTDDGDIFEMVGLAQAMTSLTTNLTGTPVEGDMFEFVIKDNGTARALTFGASFVASTVALPTITVISTELRILFQWRTNSVWSSTSAWVCIAVA